jgi:DNA polymerase-3 subunit alpha
MSVRPFAHLHCHSDFSLLDGASPIPRLVERATSCGMTALALTDHGNLYGTLEFYRTAKDAGLNPIIGYEAYVAPGSRFQKEISADKETSYHLTLLAKNRTGFQNLIKLASRAFLEGFYFKPRIDRELLAAHHEGLICLSGCASGEFSRALLKGVDPLANLAEAMEIARWFQHVFGNRYFVEIQDNGLEIQRLAKVGAVEVAKRLGIPLVATCDAHYVNRSDAEAQDVLLCINTGKFRTDTNRMKMDGDQFYLKSPEEMYEAFPDLPEAVAQSQRIADGVDLELDLNKRHFPAFPVPASKTSADYLRELCEAGLKDRYRDTPSRFDGQRLSPDVTVRLDRELDVINRLGFANYFLIVWDFVRFARERGIPAAARGSGVGAIVSYALGLSHVCPLEYDLLFERFLDENRVEAPDIDIDFCKDRRGEVIDYVKEKYGAANVAQIGTINTMAARSSIRDVGRALGMPIPRVDAVVALVPELLDVTLDDALATSSDLRRIYDSDAQIRELLDLARKVEGLAKSVGTHAAGVVIADRPLDEYVPLQKVKGKEEITTQWTKDDVERAGLLKMDLLGLRNLTILSHAIDLIRRTTGREIDIHRLPLDDAATFTLLCHGETKGIFQLESGGIRDLLQRMKPDHFHDIIATNALYRPGPLEGKMVDTYIDVKHGRIQPEYKHPVIKEILEETHGVMVYQEQVMRILNRLGGIRLSDAYACIKAISKKKLPIIARFREEFVRGATAQGLSAGDAEEVFSLVEKFAGYGFNKSHSTAYALIAYTTAWLKAHYPVEFMAALLTGDVDARNFKTKDSLVDHLDDCRRMKVDVLPPDVNASEPRFSVEEGKIRFGLVAIKAASPEAAASVVEARRRGPFTSLFDFCERVDPRAVSRTAIESLIKAGAFDSLGGHRAQWMSVLERALTAGAAHHEDRRAGQKSLFDDLDPAPAAQPQGTLPDVPRWADREQLAFEREVLGFYLSSHPLAEHEATLSACASHSTRSAASLPKKSEVVLGGMISALRIAQTKNPRSGSQATRYAMFDLEDAAGGMRCILWPEDFLTYGQHVQADAIVVLRGSIDKREGSEEANLIVNEVIPVAEAPQRFTKGVRFRLDERRHAADCLEKLREILLGYPGPGEVQLQVVLEDGRQVSLVCDGMKVELHPEMRARALELLGHGSYQLLPAPRPAGPPSASRRPSRQLESAGSRGR